MLKFRNLKDQIINSKRKSQLIQQEELLNFIQRDSSFSQINLSIHAKFQEQIQRITGQDYKICESEPNKYRLEVFKKSQNASFFDESNQKEHKKQVQHKRQFFDENITITAKQIELTQTQSLNFTKIINLMKQINDLQQIKIEYPKEQQKIMYFEIHKKLAEVKLLISMVEDQKYNNQKSCIHVYDGQDNKSPCSQDSGKTYHQQTQMSVKKQHNTNSTEQIQVVQKKSYKIIPDYDYFNQSYHEDEFECSNFEQKTIEKSIVHLFSYDKDQLFGTPLPCISQRQSQYYSPSSKNATNQNIQHKKMQNLVGQSQKKMPLKQVSQTMPNRCTKINTKSKQKNKNGYHQKLQGMVSLLQRKYKRKIKVGGENLMDSIKIAIKQKNIRPRQKK